MAPKRIRIEVCGNPAYRKFHVSTEVSTQKLYGGMIGSNRHDPYYVTSSQQEELTEATKATIKRFYAIDGITNVGLDTYEVTLTCSPAYDWEEVEEAVIDAIMVAVGWLDGDVEVGWLDGDVEVDWLFFGIVYTERVTRQDFENEVRRQRITKERMASFRD